MPGKSPPELYDQPPDDQVADAARSLLTAITKEPLPIHLRILAQALDKALRDRANH